MRPITKYDEWVCRHRYQEGAAAPVGAATCKCGTYAIATCEECGVALCGDHRYQRNARWLCAGHARAVDAADEAKRVAGIKREADRFLDHCAVYTETSDEVERYLRCVAPLATNPLSSEVAEEIVIRLGGTPAQFADWATLSIMRALRPAEVADGEEGWNTGFLARWFARTAMAAGVKPEYQFREFTERETLSGRTKRRDRDIQLAWIFGAGQQSGTLVLADGRTAATFPANRAGSGRHKVSGGSLSYVDVLRMAELLGYTKTVCEASESTAELCARGEHGPWCRYGALHHA